VGALYIVERKKLNFFYYFFLDTIIMISIYPQSDIWGLMVGTRPLLDILYTNMKTYCRQQVDKTCVLSDSLDCDWMVVAASGETIRGFAFLKKENTRTLHLTLICAALAHPMDRRSGLKDQVGGAMLRRIQEFCTERGFMRLRLEALAPVITLYHKFGWRFVHCINQREKLEITDVVKELTREIVGIRRGALDRVDAAVVELIEEDNKDITSSWWKLRNLLERNGFSAMTNECGDRIRTQARRAQMGKENGGIDYGVGMDLRKALLSREEAEELGIKSTGELVQVDPQIAGYTMVWSPRWTR
jgi:hypothetical protein